MLIRFDRTGEERKALVTAISEITGKNAKYMGAPSFAYKVGSYIITRDGTGRLRRRHFVPVGSLR